MACSNSGSNWQTHFCSVKQRTKYAFENDLFCDVSFTVNSSNGGKERLQANKFMLAISSPVFEAMFYGKLAENDSTIDLPDCRKEGLQQMLQFIHSDKVNLSGNNVMEVMYVAEKYILPSLVQKCKEYLKESLTPEEVFTILPQKLCRDDEELEQHCWHLVDSETKRAVCSEPFLNLSQGKLSEVLSRDTLKVKELDLFLAVDKWASKKLKERGIVSNGKNKRDILGKDIIKMIRFPVMKVKEFAEFVLPCEILKKGELTEIFHTFYSITKSTSVFNSKQRKLGPFTSDCRFKHVMYGDASSVTKCTNAIRFKTDKPVLLVGVRMFGQSGKVFEMNLSISKSGKGIILSEPSSEFATETELTDGTYHGFSFELNEPLQLEKDEWYRLFAVINGPPAYSGTDGKTELAVEDPCGESFKIAYKSDYDYTKYSSLNHGQFPAFIFQNLLKD